MGESHLCPWCLTPLSLAMELGELVLRCHACQWEAIEQDSRHASDQRLGYTKPWWKGSEL